MSRFEMSSSALNAQMFDEQVRIGGGDVAPAQESLFPKEAGRSEGRVEQVRIVQGLPGGLNEQAIAAVEK